MGNNVKLSKSISVKDYRDLVAGKDRKALARFISERFDERYFNPILSSKIKHGFANLAIGCLVLETLEAFYQGKENTNKISKRMFSDFFKRDTLLKVFDSDDDWFYKNIRCAILHQGETRNGWRILRKGKLLDFSEKTINANKFILELQKAVREYAINLEEDEKIWHNFQIKMNAICNNCCEI